MIIRQLEASDWPEVPRIYKEGIGTGLATFQTDVPTWAEWDSAKLSFCRLVAVMSNKVVGWAGLSATSSRCVYAGVAEVSVYVDESYRGQGIGKTLLTSVITESDSNGIWTLQSGIMRNNSASIALHEACGFRTVGYRERIARDCNGVWRDTVIMERRSNASAFI